MALLPDGFQAMGYFAQKRSLLLYRHATTKGVTATAKRKDRTVLISACFVPLRPFILTTCCMFEGNPVFHFSIPPTSSAGAWCLAVVLIARANLSKPSSYEVELGAVFDQGRDSLHPTFRMELLLAIAGFKFSTVELDDDLPECFDNMGAFTSMPLFSTTAFDGGWPGSVKVHFQARALPFLRRLQRGIYELFHQQELFPTALSAHMRSESPQTVLEMPGSHRYMTGFLDNISCGAGLPLSWADGYEAQLEADKKAALAYGVRLFPPFPS